MTQLGLEVSRTGYQLPTVSEFEISGEKQRRFAEQHFLFLQRMGRKISARCYATAQRFYRAHGDIAAIPGSPPPLPARLTPLRFGVYFGKFCSNLNIS